MSAGWLQVNAALDRTEHSPRVNAWLAFGLLTRVIDLGRGAALDLFFFQRKPPDLRLRFSTADVAVTQQWMSPILDSLVEASVFASWHLAPYEPDWRKLGSHRAMDGYHRWADVDTRAWLAFDRWAGEPGLDARRAEDAMVASIMGPHLDDLFVEVVGDGHEVWDTWCNLLDLAGPGHVAPGLIVGDGTDPAATEAMSGPLADLRRADAELAQTLHEALAAGDSDTGLRATVAFIAQLSLNRWGLDGPAQRALAGAYAEARDPRSGLRGDHPLP
jgi:hypothetical protein